MDSSRHDGRHVLITGGGSGFGRATALRFAHEGAAHVVLVDRLQDRLDTVAAEVAAAGATVTTVCEDLSTFEGSDAAVRRGLEGAGHLDVVVSNAAAWTQEPFIDMPDASWLKVIAVNLNASLRGRPAQRAGHAGSRRGRRDPVHRRRSARSAAVRASRTTTRRRPRSRTS